MKLDLWQVDAFTSTPLTGNPAAVVPLEAWLPDSLMQAIALAPDFAKVARIEAFGVIATAPGTAS